jgi:transcriptional regulator with XRE-family HTH domain
MTYIDRTYLGSLERGLENPTVVVLDKLAARFRFPLQTSFELHRAARDRLNRCRLGGAAKLKS